MNAFHLAFISQLLFTSLAPSRSFSRASTASPCVEARSCLLRWVGRLSLCTGWPLRRVEYSLPQRCSRVLKCRLHTCTATHAHTWLNRRTVWLVSWIQCGFVVLSDACARTQRQKKNNNIRADAKHVVRLWRLSDWSHGDVSVEVGLRPIEIK